MELANFKNGHQYGRCIRIGKDGFTSLSYTDQGILDFAKVLIANDILGEN
jgi:hypothetical protein